MQGIYNFTLGRMLADKKRRNIALAVFLPLCLAALTLVIVLSIQSASTGIVTPVGTNSVNVYVSGTKAVKGTGAPSQNFTFTIQRWTTNNASTGAAHSDQSLVSGKNTVIVPTNGPGIYDFNFPAITFPSPGTNNGDKAIYYFRVTETSGGGTGWTNDTSAKIVVVTVKRDRRSGSTLTNYGTYDYNDVYALLDYSDNNNFNGQTRDTYKWEDPDRSKPFGSASYYGVFALGNFNFHGADTEGGIAVKGNLNLINGQSVLVGAVNAYYNGGAYPARSYNPASSNPLDEGKAVVRGNVTYGTTPSGSRYLQAIGGKIHLADSSTYTGMTLRAKWYTGTDNDFTYINNAIGENPPGLPNSWTTGTSALTRIADTKLDSFFTDAERELKALSAKYLSYTTAGNQDNGKTLVSNVSSGSSLSASLPSGSAWSQYDKIIFNYTGTTASPTVTFPTGFTGNIIINYKRTSAVSLTGFITPGGITVGSTALSDMHLALRGYAGRIIFNFPDTVPSITIGSSSGAGVIGHILAPSSNVTLGASGSAFASVNGDIVCKDFYSYNGSGSNGSEQHNSTLTSCVRGHLQFTNTYGTAPTAGSITIPGRKTVEVLSGTPTGGTFTFSIAHTNSSGTNQNYPSGVTVTATGLTGFPTSGNPRTGTITRNTAGDSNFSYSISGLAVGTHYFVVRESSGGTGSDWTNDTREYLIEVTIPSGGGAGSITQYKERPNSSTTWASISWVAGAAGGNSSTWDWTSSATVTYPTNNRIENPDGYQLMLNGSNVVLASGYCLKMGQGGGPNGSYNIYTNAFTNKDQVIWIISNGFWSKMRPELLTTSNQSANSNIDWMRVRYGISNLTPAQAYFGTQLAVWRYTNDIDFSPGTSTTDAQFKANILANLHPVHDAAAIVFINGWSSTYLANVHNMYKQLVAGAVTRETIMPGINISFNTSGANLSGGWYGPVTINIAQAPGTFNSSLSAAVTAASGYTVREGTSGSGSSSINRTNGQTFYINVGGTMPSGVLVTASADATVNTGGKHEDIRVFYSNGSASNGQPVAGFSINSDGRVTVIGTATLGGSGGVFGFTNKYTYTSTPATAAIQANKTVNKNGSPTDPTFTFNIVRVTDETGNTASTGADAYSSSQNRTTTGSVTFNLTDLARPASGTTYYYKITETQGSTTGWDYSKMEYIVRVGVPSGNGSVTYGVRSRDGSTGGWTPSSSWGTYTAGSSVAFTNTYTPGTVNAAIQANKTVNKNGSPTDPTFTFNIVRVTDETGNTASTGTDAYSSSQNRTTTGSVTFNLTDLARPASGTTYYYYKITETQGSTTGWDYSKMEYIVRVGVPSGNGSVTYGVRSRDGSTGGWTPSSSWGTYTAGSSVAFTNTYTPPTGSLKLLKELSVTRPGTITDATTFQMKVKIGSAYMTVNADNEYTGTNSTGSIFYVSVNAPVTITKIPTGTVCVLEEVSGSGDVTGWTKTVSYSPASVTVGNGNTVELTAKNSYEQLTYPAAIRGTKTLTGTPVTPQSFVFTLTHTNSGGTAAALPSGVNINGSATNPQTQTLSAGGNFQFEITGLTSTGSPYYFTLAETTGGSGGPGTWSNDPVKYLIRVQVSPSGDVTYSYQSSTVATPVWGTDWTAGLPAAPNNGRFTFSNTYTAPAIVLIKAVKNASGAPMTAEQFTFALYEFETNGLLKALPLQTAKNADAGESGSVIFLPLTFTEAKEYVYYLTEVNEEHPGWMMDKTRYRIYINVEELAGVMTAEVTYIEADDDGEEIAGRTLRIYKENDLEFWPDFNNVYGGPRLPEVGGIGKDIFITAGIGIILLVSTLGAGVLIYTKQNRRRCFLKRE